MNCLSKTATRTEKVKAWRRFFVFFYFEIFASVTKIFLPEKWIKLKLGDFDAFYLSPSCLYGFASEINCGEYDYLFVLTLEVFLWDGFRRKINPKTFPKKCGDGSIRFFWFNLFSWTTNSWQSMKESSVCERTDAFWSQIYCSITLVIQAIFVDCYPQSRSWKEARWPLGRLKRR